MINQDYVNWLVSWIQNGNMNMKTSKPFTIDDVINPEYKSAVQAKLQK